MNTTPENPIAGKSRPTPAHRTILSDAQLQTFLDDGFLLVHNVLPQNEIDEINAHLWECKRQVDETGTSPFGFQFDKPLYKATATFGERHLESIRGNLESDPFFRKMARDPRILDIAEQIIGPNIRLYTSQYVGKPAFVGVPHAWHQDTSYWNTYAPAYFSFWISLDGSDVENGCVHFIPGTHKLGMLPTVPRKLHQEAFMQENYQETTPPWTVPTVEGAPDVHLDFSKSVPAILPPGSLSIHNALAVHTSAPNPSPRPRGAVILTYIQADLPKRNGKPSDAPIVRGRGGLIPEAE